MSRIDDLIAEMCPDGVEYIPLGDALKNGNAIDSVSKKDYKNVGAIPIIDQSQAYIAGYTDHKSAIPPVLPCIIFGDHTRAVKYAEEIFAQGDSGTKVFIPSTDKFRIKFIYYSFCNLEIQSRGYNRHWSIVKDMEIPCPPLQIQEEIVRILDAFTTLEAELEAELEARKKQYEYYRDELLTFGNDVEWKTLGEISTDIFRGSGITRDQVTVDGCPCVRYGEIYTTYNIWFDKCVSHTDPTKIQSKKFFEYGDILFAITGENVEEIAKSCTYVGHDKCLAGGDLVVMKHNENPKYIAYALATRNAQEQKSKGKVKSKVVHSSVPALKNIRIPVPSLPEQARIVEILDRFDALINDITQGLPAEIAARRKQYEYYRDKLLSFKEKVS